MGKEGLPLKTDLKTLNNIIKSLERIQNINCNAVFQQRKEYK
jgi:hypothetical protein